MLKEVEKRKITDLAPCIQLNSSTIGIATTPFSNTYNVDSSTYNFLPEYNERNVKCDLIGCSF